MRGIPLLVRLVLGPVTLNQSGVSVEILERSSANVLASDFDRLVLVDAPNEMDLKWSVTRTRFGGVSV